MNLKYITVDTILSRIYREIPEEDINDTDAIERIFEALEYIKIPEISKEQVEFLQVEKFECPLPKGLRTILQIAKKRTRAANSADISTKLGTYTNQLWLNSYYYKNHFTPVRLSNNVFYNTIVQKDFDERPYNAEEYEYTIITGSDSLLRFNFTDGEIALSYLTVMIDEKTGYPLIPDIIDCSTAITYYVKWKISEMYSWKGREHFDKLAVYNKQLWEKYLAQTVSWLRLPQTIDDYQDLMEESMHLIPRVNRYYNYFNKLGKKEDRLFNHPDDEERYRGRR